MAECSHCGEETSGYAMIEGERVCHPDDPELPDCYRRVAVYREKLGTLMDMLIKPRGVEEIEDSVFDDWADALASLSEELGFYDIEPTVCVSHLRFVPCRRHEGNTPCVLSDNEEDVRRVSAYQRGEDPEKDLLESACPVHLDSPVDCLPCP